MNFSVDLSAGDLIVHPCAASLSAAGIKIHIESGDFFAFLVFNDKEFDVIVPDGRFFFFDFDREHLLDESEHSFKNSGFREVLLYFIFRVRELCFTEFFTDEGKIPSLDVLDAELVPAVINELFHFFFCCRFGFGS